MRNIDVNLLITVCRHQWFDVENKYPPPPSQKKPLKRFSFNKTEKCKHSRANCGVPMSLHRSYCDWNWIENNCWKFSIHTLFVHFFCFYSFCFRNRGTYSLSKIRTSFPVFLFFVLFLKLDFFFLINLTPHFCVIESNR